MVLELARPSEAWCFPPGADFFETVLLLAAAVVTGNGGFALTLGTYSSEEKLSTAPGFTLNLRIQPKVSSVLPEILKSAGH